MASHFQSSELGKLSSFPSLTNEEFAVACRALLNRVHAVGKSTVGWSSLRFQEPGPTLRISLELHDNLCNALQEDTPAQPAVTADGEDSLLEASEDDPEALVRTTDSGRLQVDFDILLSPIYQVPVLYFILRRAVKPLSLDEIYSYLVPDQYRKHIQGVGIMGGISSGYHPVSGLPAFFVHPCNTAEAMKDVASGHGISPEAYLIIWLGLMGNCVYLRLPSELFAKDIPKLSTF